MRQPRAEAESSSSQHPQRHKNHRFIFRRFRLALDTINRHRNKNARILLTGRTPKKAAAVAEFKLPWGQEGTTRAAVAKTKTTEGASHRRGAREGFSRPPLRSELPPAPVKIDIITFAKAARRKPKGLPSGLRYDGRRRSLSAQSPTGGALNRVWGDGGCGKNMMHLFFSPDISQAG